MKSATKGAWRFVRCLLLIACAGGILAADNTWLSSINLEAIQSESWFSNDAENDLADTSMLFDHPASPAHGSAMSMAGLIHGLLFSRPSGHWTLNSFAHESNSPVVELAPITQINGGDSFAGFNTQRSFTAYAASSSTIVHGSGITPSTITTGTGTWAVDNSGTWTNPANWVGNNVPDGAGSFADISQVNLTANRTVTLDVSRTVGRLTIGDTDGTHSYTLDASPGATLTFDQSPNFGFAGVLTQSATSAGDTISAPIVIGNVNYLSVQNASAATFTISGNISSSAGSKIIQFDSGVINVTGVISNGTTGNFVQVGVVGTSVVTLTGTNTYTGGTSINGATLFVNGDNSGATGSVSVVNSGSLLGGTGTIGGSVTIGGGGTITGGTDTSVGTLTLLGNLSFNAGESSGSRYLVNLSGSTSDKLAISGALNLGNSFGDVLNFSGMADGTSTYVLATYASHVGQFDSVFNLPAGYSLVYLPTELDLVSIPIPEPATWLGGAIAVAALLWTQRRRFAKRA